MRSRRYKPGVWQRLGLGLRALRGMTTRAFPFSFPVWQLGKAIPLLFDFLTFVREGYAKNALVYACISYVAGNAASAPLVVWEITPEGSRVPMPGHELNALLKRPNPQMGSFEFIELEHTYLNLAGDAYVVLTDGQGGGREMWMARPDRMRPVIGTFGSKDATVPGEKGVIGFIYQDDAGKKTPFAPDEVIHVKLPNPGDEFEGLGHGLSPLAAAALETDIDNQVSTFRKTLFLNGAIPFGLLTSKGTLDKEEVKLIRNRINENHTGQRNWNKLLILDADASYEQMGTDLDKLALPQLNRISETRICMVFKVTPLLIGTQAGLDASTLANFEAAQKFAWEQKITVDNRRLADAYTTHFQNLGELADNQEIDFDYSNVDALEDDRGDAFTRADQGIKSGFLTINEARAEVNMPALLQGNVLLLPFNLLPTDVDLAKGSPPARGVRKSLSAPGFEDIGELYSKSLDLVARSWELRYREESAKLFEDELSKLLASLGGRRSIKQIDWGQVLKDLLATVALNVENWTTVFFALTSGLLDDQGENFRATFGIAWDLQDPNVQAFISDYTFKFATRLAANTEQAVSGLVAQAQAEGWSTGKLADELERIYSGWTRSRAEMIARTETIRSSNAGAMEALLNANIEQKQWFTALDARVCPFCNSLHGKIISTGGNFFNQGDTLTVEIPEEEFALWKGLSFEERDGVWRWSGGAFEVVPDSKAVVSLALSYDDVPYPPLHPLCRCTILAVFDS